MQQIYYCDCQELSIVNGSTIRSMLDSRDPDDAFAIYPTELNSHGYCKHCGYLPMRTPHRDTDWLGQIKELDPELRAIKRVWWYGDYFYSGVSDE